MRITYRNHDNKQYWTRRWADIPVDEPMKNTRAYPLRYAIMAAEAKPDGKILEAGCGAGRIMRYFHRLGREIVGFDFIGAVVEKLKTIEPDLNVQAGDICSLNYPDDAFDCVMAFGLYHNLPPEKLDRALSETYRVTVPGGILCASFRADNLTNLINDWMKDRQNGNGQGQKQFHKLNLSEKEFRDLLERNGFDIESMHYVINMPLLYKFACFRHAGHKTFNEHAMRQEGCLLNRTGNLVQSFLVRYFPGRYCNIYVAIARKPARP